MEAFDLRSPLNALFKRWRIFAQLLAGVLGVVVIGWLMTPDRYTSTAVLMLESKRQELIQVSKDNPSVSRAADIGIADVLSEVEILKSDELRYRTAENLEPGLMERLGVDAEDENPQRRGAGLLRQGLGIKPVTNSKIINVSFTHGDPGVAVEIVNEFTRFYLEYRTDLSLAQIGLENLEREQELALLEMREAETKLREFGREYHLVASTEEKNALLSVLSRLRTESAEKVVLLEKNKQLNEDLREKMDQSSPNIDQLEEVRRDPTTIYLENELAARRVELAQLLQNSTEKNKEVIRVRRSIEGLEEALAEERESVVRSVLYNRDSETEGVRSEVAAYHDLEMAILEELDQIRDRELQGGNLELLLGIQQDRYTQVSKRLDLMRMEAALGSAGGVEVVIASRAYKPRRRSSPLPLKLFLLSALVGGTMLGLAVVLILDSFDHSFKTPQEVERALAVPVLATLPKSKPEPVND